MSRLLACPLPTNINPLSPIGYKFSIERIPEVTYFCQSVDLPEVSLPDVGISTPFVTYPVAGDHMSFGDLTVQFLIDSDMSNYKALFNWLRGLGFPEDHQQYADQVTSIISSRLSEVAASSSDATLMILNNSNNVVSTVQFVDCIPSSLSGLSFTSVTQDVQYLVGTATFKYSYYRFI